MTTDLGQHSAGYARFITALVLYADKNLMHTDGTLGPVARLAGDAEIAVCVWPDKTAPHGASFLVVKGGDVLQEMITTGATARIWERITAIPCPSREQAEAAHGLFDGATECKAEFNARNDNEGGDDGRSR